MPIEHISDTARWVAFYRAMESERPDAVFRDPYARRLAGERGEQIVREMPRGRQMAWPMVVRTAVFDEIILDTIRREHVDLVVNLAAGLDARAFRLHLPASLRWVDVDLPGILDYKLGMLAKETPRCRYEAVRADLTDEAVRKQTFDALFPSAQRTLVVTEGLLIYLTREQVARLATDLASYPSVRWWLFDLASPMLLRRMMKMWGKQVSAGNAPFQFAPEESTAFFAPFGWRERVFRNTMEDAVRLKRTMPGAWLWRLFGLFTTRAQKEKFKRFAGQVLLERTT